MMMSPAGRPRPIDDGDPVLGNVILFAPTLNERAPAPRASPHMLGPQHADLVIKC